jgi:hypothetical protein
MNIPNASYKNKAGNFGPPYYFYYENGKPTVTLRFSEQDHQYYEEIGDRLEPRKNVTSILRIIDKSVYLMPWAAKVMGEKLLATIPRSKKGIIERITAEKFEALVKSSKSAWREKRDAAADIGNRAHACLETAIRGAIDFADGVVSWAAIESAFIKDEDKRVMNCCSAAFSWMKQHNVRWLKTESKIYSKMFKYAGTMDGLCLVDSCTDHVCCPTRFRNQRSIPDWKSSNQLSLDYLYQTAAYQQAEFEETGIQIDARWIHRLGKEDGKFESWYTTDFETHLSGFLTALMLLEIQELVELRMGQVKDDRTARKVATKEAEDLIASLDEL